MGRRGERQDLHFLLLFRLPSSLSPNMGETGHYQQGNDEEKEEEDDS